MALSTMLPEKTTAANVTATNNTAAMIAFFRKTTIFKLSPPVSTDYSTDTAIMLHKKRESRDGFPVFL
jgi:hypothetical protein